MLTESGSLEALILRNLAEVREKIELRRRGKINEPNIEEALRNMRALLKEESKLSKMVVSARRIDRNARGIDTLTSLPFLALVDSFCALVVRDPQVIALIAEIFAKRDAQILLDPTRAWRRWINVCTVFALAWHLGVFNSLRTLFRVITTLRFRRG